MPRDRATPARSPTPRGPRPASVAAPRARSGTGWLALYGGGLRAASRFARRSRTPATTAPESPPPTPCAIGPPLGGSGAPPRGGAPGVGRRIDYGDPVPHSHFL